MTSLTRTKLESLVSMIEQSLIPYGFQIIANRLVYDDDGNQLAEFDLEVRGKIGTATIAWLIECRDRPASGTAPGSWIEQLVGRRARYGFNKVTAVSATGFSPSARHCARQEGIDLREVQSLEFNDFSSWLTTPQKISSVRHHIRLLEAKITAKAESAQPTESSISETVVSIIDPAATDICSNQSGASVSIFDVFRNTAESESFFSKRYFKDLTETRFLAQLETTNPLFIQIKQQRLKIVEVEFLAEFWIEDMGEHEVNFTRYRDSTSDDSLVEVVSFPYHSAGGLVSIEIIRHIETSTVALIARTADGVDVSERVFKEVKSLPGSADRDDA